MLIRLMNLSIVHITRKQLAGPSPSEIYSSAPKARRYSWARILFMYFVEISWNWCWNHLSKRSFRRINGFLLLSIGIVGSSWSSRCCRCWLVQMSSIICYLTISSILSAYVIFLIHCWIVWLARHSFSTDECWVNF